MRRIPIRRAVVTGAVGASLIGLAVPSMTAAASAAPSNPSEPTCFTGSATDPDGGYSFHTDGTAQAEFSIDLPSCPGASYSFTINGQALKPLGWTTISAVAEFFSPTDSNHQKPIADPVAPVSTTVSNGGGTVTITFTGDGVAQAFKILGQTSGYLPQECVTMAASTGIASVAVAQSDLRSACDNGGEGGGFW